MLVSSICSLLLTACTPSTPAPIGSNDMAAHTDATMPTVDMRMAQSGASNLTLSGAPYGTASIKSVTCPTSPDTGATYVSAAIPGAFSDGTSLSGRELSLSIYGIDIQIVTSTAEIVFEKFGTYPIDQQGTLPSTTLDGSGDQSGQQVQLSGTWSCP
jgi:hypothetical protein